MPKLTKKPIKAKKDSRTEYKNQHRTTTYDRVELILPNGTKDRLKEVSSTMGISVNDYISRLIKADLDKDHKSTEFVTLLKKWEVREKYHSMIESASYTASQGYYIRLKKGYINDESGTDEIICKTTRELRHFMQFTHTIRTPEEMCGHDSKTYEQLIRWEVPKNQIALIESVGKHYILFKSGEKWEFASVHELRYKWKGTSEK